MSDEFQMQQLQPDTTQDKAMREGVYQGIRNSLIRGRFAPGEKLVLRQLAGEFGVSLTPVREALHRLVTEGILTQEHSRSVRVPVLSNARVLELRDIRVALEGLAAERAAMAADAAELKELERLARAVDVARKSGDVAADAQKVAEFQVALYGMSKMPVLVRHIEMLWLQTGPYIPLLHPDYIHRMQQIRPGWRYALCEAIKERNGAKARQFIETDISEALSYLATLLSAAALIKRA
ncbi:MAG TPA: GntR family transcriptional regulator [Bordetella sp.]|nr:GntR family transcriptional regulator [Bordetella sp.]